MKQQLAGHIFACCTTPAPSLPLMARFGVQNGVGGFENMAVLDTSSGPYANIWVGEATRGLFKGIVDVS